MGRGGACINYCEPRIFHVNSEIESGKMQGNVDEVVIIDLDTDGLPDVIIIDVPESVQQRFSGASVARAGKRFPVQGIISIDDDDDDEAEIDESNYVDDHSEFNVNDDNNTKNKNSHPFASVRNYDDADVDGCRVVSEKRRAFKLSACIKDHKGEYVCRNRHDLNFECETKSCSSDCEVVEGSLSELREQWLKAFQNRKLHTKGRYYPKDRASPNVRAENSTKQNVESAVDSMSENVNLDVNSSEFTSSGDGFVRGAFSSGMEYPSAESDEKIEPRETCLEDVNFWFDECQSENGHGTRFQNEREGHLGPSSSSIPEGNIKQCHNKRSHFHHNELRTTGETNVQDDDASLCKYSVNPGGVVSLERDGEFTPIPSNLAQHKNLDSKKKDMVIAGSSSYAEAQKPATSSFCNIPISEVKNPLDASFSVLRDIINKREKLKETDGFKRAVEEEWAARERRLQIQAEEAQRLRKRKKAESLRILNMEKRLKQRVEEVRETQRKDEENLNIKENLRADMRKELYQLENTVTDMASLLRGLGIDVGGGSHPLALDVHAAYKRALLKFHPDRASKTDVRQQVEAEEKFKLISRMKEKFLSTS